MDKHVILNHIFYNVKLKNEKKKTLFSLMMMMINVH